MNKRVFRKTKINGEAYQKIKDDAGLAEAFLANKLVKNYLNDSLTTIENLILNNSVKDVKERVSITKGSWREFFIPKKVQVDELSGQYRFIQKMIKDMEDSVQRARELENKVSSGEVIIEV